MRYRWVSLRPVYDADLPWLFRLLCDPFRSRLWFRERTVFDQAQFESAWRLWISREIFAKFIILENEKPVGLCFDSHRSLEDGHSYLAALLEDRAIGKGTGVFAAALLGEWLFQNLPLRKINFDVLGFNHQVLKVLEKLNIRSHACSATIILPL